MILSIFDNIGKTTFNIAMNFESDS